jgi:hypothetical protein
MRRQGCRLIDRVLNLAASQAPLISADSIGTVKRWQRVYGWPTAVSRPIDGSSLPDCMPVTLCNQKVSSCKSDETYEFLGIRVESAWSSGHALPSGFGWSRCTSRMRSPASKPDCRVVFLTARREEGWRPYESDWRLRRCIGPDCLELTQDPDSFTGAGHP